MRHYSIFCFFYLAITLNIFAQKANYLQPPTQYRDIYKNRTLKSTFLNIPLFTKQTSNFPLDNLVQQYLFESIPHLTPNSCQLVLKYKIKSPGGIHLTYQQYISELPVFSSEIKVNLDNNNHIRSIQDNSYDLRNISTIDRPGISEASYIKDFIYKYYDSLTTYSWKPVWFYDDVAETKLVPLYHIDIDRSKPSQREELLIDDQYQIYYKNDLKIYFTDTIAKAYVFMPDPLTSAQVDYGAPYIDANDSDIVELNNERVLVDLYVDFMNDSFVLSSPYIQLVDFEDSFIAISKSDVDSFLFTRSQSGFEDVNVYYHIYTFQQYLQSIGFINLPDTNAWILWADPHGEGTADNSAFTNSGNILRLSFGIGGVDDAEDADVIVHEYTHALSYAAAPESNSGGDRRAIDEGLGDYFAASYSKDISTYNWENVFSWDGHNEYWLGRSVATNKHYPEDVNTSIHQTGEIWSSALMNIWDSIGKGATDSLVLQYLYSQTKNMTMRDAAWQVIEADTFLNNGKYTEVLYKYFCIRGFLNDSSICNKYVPPDTTPKAPETPPNNYQILLYNTAAFFNSTGNLYIIFPIGTDVADIYIYNTLGVELHHEEYYSDAPLKIEDQYLSTGTYFIKVHTEFKEKVFKVIKAQ